MNQDTLITTIDAAWEARTNFSPTSHPVEVAEAVEHVIAELNAGRIRVAEKNDGEWVTHQWIKKAVLLSFRLKDNVMMRAGDLGFFDKVETKFVHLDEAAMRATGVRVVPPAVARRGAFIGKNVVLMARWWTLGQPLALAPRLVKTFISQVAWALVGCWNQFRRTLLSLRTIALLGRAQRW
jgi:2,3,4,5-tetrahydropyridine-2,6-dicarboxylate N-succinyltransferase